LRDFVKDIRNAAQPISVSASQLVGVSAINGGRIFAQFVPDIAISRFPASAPRTDICPERRFRLKGHFASASASRAAHARLPAIAMSGFA
jgi:hypothetical protein